MTHHLKENPAARASAGRVRDMFRLATERDEDTRNPLSLQQAFLVRRGIAPALAPILAELAFPMREGARS
jgi:hypothetical protein